MRYKVERVTRAACASNAKKLGLDDALVMGVCFVNLDGSRSPTTNAVAEAFEALIGAIFIVRHDNNNPTWSCHAYAVVILCKGLGFKVTSSRDSITPILTSGL